MKTLQNILTQITQLTSNIETNYPELYATLGENPTTIPSMAHPDINKTIMEDYLDSLKQILKQYIITHKKL
jgi:hypothetical protein